MTHWLFSLNSGSKEYENVRNDQYLKHFKDWLCRTFDRHKDNIGDSPEQFRHNLSVDFNSSAWHLFLLSYFDACNICIIKPKPYGPDIILNHNKKLVYVEATRVTVGVAGENYPVDINTNNEVVSLPYPDPKIQLRLINSINYKKKKIDDYIDRKIISPDASVILALNCNLNFRNLYVGTYNSYFFRTLYSLGSETIFIDQKTLKVTDQSISIKDKVEKYSSKRDENIEIDSKFFQFKEYSNIAAVIATDNDVYNLFWKKGVDLEIIHNINAQQPLLKDFGPIPYAHTPIPISNHKFKLEIERKKPAMFYL
ncbi:MAG: hypothetical protein M9962_03280 [Oligoflexia bacterium]|nr:hypothetical protein [Oligoflexia bacterium]